MTPDDIETQRKAVKDLEKRLEAAKKRLTVLTTFPLKTKIYVHGSQEDMCYKGEQIGLTGSALENFERTAYEIGFDVEIDTDGVAYATHVNGVALVERVEI